VESLKQMTSYTKYKITYIDSLVSALSTLSTGVIQADNCYE